MCSEIMYEVGLGQLTQHFMNPSITGQRNLELRTSSFKNCQSEATGHEVTNTTNQPTNQPSKPMDSITAITFINTTLTTICRNCSKQVNNASSSSSSSGISLETVKRIELGILVPILLGAVFGNILLITSIVAFRHLRSVPNFLILHLAICDLSTAMVSIPFTLMYRHYNSYPFGKFGCKVIWPLATFTTNASVLTLVSIAVERFLAIYAFSFLITRGKVMVILVCIHILSFSSVVPYSYHLDLLEYLGSNYCHESWIGTNEQKGYTIFLFLLQYGIPLPILITLYALSWFKIRNQNKKMIDLSEEYERKMAWGNEQGGNETNKRNTVQSDTSVTFDSESNKSLVSVVVEKIEQPKYRTTKENQETTTRQAENNNSISVKYSKNIDNVPIDRLPNVNNSSDVNPRISTGSGNSSSGSFEHSSRTSRAFHQNETLRSIRTKFHNLRKPKYISHTAYLRHQQTVRTLTMFTLVVIVFLIFALPNQIIWLVKDFMPPEKQPRVEVLLVFNFLTYASSIVNCWIYGGFNKHFRKAYKRILQGQCHGDLTRVRTLTSTTMVQPILTSNNDPEQNDAVESRNDAFTDMFKQHIDHFEQFRHLYFHDEETEEEAVLVQPESKPKRKLTIASLWSSLTTSSNSLRSRKYSLIPPIIPFTQDTGLGRRRCSAPVVRIWQPALSVTTTPANTFLPQEVPKTLFKRRASTPAQYGMPKAGAQDDAIQQTRLRKPSLLKALVPKFYRPVERKPVKSELEVLTIKILEENDTYPKDANIELQEIETTEIKGHNIHKTQRRNIKRADQIISPQIQSTEITPKMARQLSTFYRPELSLHTIVEDCARPQSLEEAQSFISSFKYSTESKTVAIKNSPYIQEVEFSRQPLLHKLEQRQDKRVDIAQNEVKPTTGFPTAKASRDTTPLRDTTKEEVAHLHVTETHITTDIDGNEQKSSKPSPVLQRKAALLAKGACERKKVNRNSLNILKMNKLASQRKTRIQQLAMDFPQKQIPLDVFKNNNKEGNSSTENLSLYNHQTFKPRRKNSLTELFLGSSEPPKIENNSIMRKNYLDDSSTNQVMLESITQVNSCNVSSVDSQSNNNFQTTQKTAVTKQQKYVCSDNKDNKTSSTIKTNSVPGTIITTLRKTAPSTIQNISCNGKTVTKRSYISHPNQMTVHVPTNNSCRVKISSSPRANVPLIHYNRRNGASTSSVIKKGSVSHNKQKTAMPLTRINSCKVMAPSVNAQINVGSSNDQTTVSTTAQKNSCTINKISSTTTTNVVSHKSQKVTVSIAPNKQKPTQFGGFTRLQVKPDIVPQIPRIEIESYSILASPKFSRRTKLTEHVLAKKLSIENV